MQSPSSAVNPSVLSTLLRLRIAQRLAPLPRGTRSEIRDDFGRDDRRPVVPRAAVDDAVADGQHAGARRNASGATP